jgi:hypothetical protein
MSPSRCPSDVGRESELPMIRSVCVRLQACLIQLYLLRPAPFPPRGGYSHVRGMARHQGCRRRELLCGAPLGVGVHPMLLLPRWFTRAFFGQVIENLLWNERPYQSPRSIDRFPESVPGKLYKPIFLRPVSTSTQDIPGENA